MNRRVGLIVLAVAMAAAPWVLPPFYVTLLNYIGISTLVALGLVLLTGVGGLTSFGQAAFMGVGAYATAVLCTHRLPLAEVWVSPGWGLVAGWVITGVLAWALGVLTLRLQGHYLPLGTMAWGLSLYFVFGTVELFGGHAGLTDVPPVTLFGVPLVASEQMHYLIWSVTALAAWTTVNLLDSRAGRAIRALKGGRVMAESMGADTAHSRQVIFLLAALQASTAGWLYAHLQRFVNPSPFSLSAGIDYLFMAVAGGAAQVAGALAGAATLTVLRQWLQDLLPALLGRAGNFESMVFGVLLILLLQRAREGLVGQWLTWRPTQRQREVPSAEPLARRSPPARGEPVLQACDVTRRFGGLVANDAMNLTLHAGEVLGLIGPNGAGKSTLFNQLSGVDTPTAGEVRFLGRAVTGATSRELARGGLGRTFQHVKLLPRMSVLENVALGAHTRGQAGVLRAAWRLDRAEEARLLAEAARQLDRVGLGDLRDRPAGSLSLGQQRVLEIARALAGDPCVLLLDEPAAGLRHPEKQVLAILLQKLREEGLAILLVEHDMDFVMNLVDRIVVMDHGCHIAEGTPAEIQVHPAVLEAYLGGA